MIDIGIAWDPTYMEGVISFNPANNDLVTDSGLLTMTIISLFTDARANADDPVPNQVGLLTDYRGWWADSTAEKKGDSIGSKLWLLERSNATSDNLAKAKQYIMDALKWMIDEGIASKILVTTEFGGSAGDRLYFNVQIVKPTGTTVNYQFDSAWGAMRT